MRRREVRALAARMDRLDERVAELESKYTSLAAYTLRVVDMYQTHRKPDAPDLPPLPDGLPLVRR